MKKTATLKKMVLLSAASLMIFSTSLASATGLFSEMNETEYADERLPILDEVADMWNKSERSTLGCGKENERVSPAAALDWDLFVACWLEGWCSAKMIRKMWKNTLDKRSVSRSTRGYRPPKKRL